MSPYIPQDKREPYQEAILSILDNLSYEADDKVDGVVNYIFTKILKEFYAKPKTELYFNYNRVIGVLESCKLELFRVVIAPYEDRKMVENRTV